MKSDSVFFYSLRCLFLKRHATQDISDLIWMISPSHLIQNKPNDSIDGSKNISFQWFRQSFMNVKVQNWTRLKVCELYWIKCIFELWTIHTSCFFCSATKGMFPKMSNRSLKATNNYSFGACLCETKNKRKTFWPFRMSDKRELLNRFVSNSQLSPVHTIGTSCKV